MAHGTTLSSSLERISSYLECIICKDSYKQPKILDCQHSFCEKCLETYYTSRYRGASKIPCPVCRRETVLSRTRIQGLKTNFHLMGIVEEFSIHEKAASSGSAKVVCEICDEGNEPTHHCLDCEQNICLNCRKTHLRCTATSGHRVATFEEKQTATKTTEADVSYCHKHKGEVKHFYCETCQVLICRDCTVIDHREPQHHYTDTEEASLKCRQSLKELFPDFNDEIQQLEQSLVASSQSKQDFTRKITQTVNVVQDRAAEIRAEVTTQEHKIIDEIKCHQLGRIKICDEQEKTISMMLQRKQHSLETAKDVANTASDRDFLSLYPIILNDLKSQSGQNPPKTDPHLSYPSFIQGQGIGDINLGKLEVEVGKWQLHCEFGKEKSGPGEFSGAQGITATQPDELAVADNWNEQVVFCSTEGDYKGNIPMPKAPRGIAAFHNWWVVVDSTKFVKLFTNDKKLAFQFPTVPPSEVDKTKVDLQSVAVKKDGTIIVGDVKRMVLTEHNPNDGSLIYTTQLKSPPYFLAVDSCNDRVVISGKGQQVAIADSRGVTQSTIKPIINGQPVRSCRGVCCDRLGLYAAMSNAGSGHIHHYDHNGSFLACLAQDLHNPWGITFIVDGQLVVADFSSIKMYHKV